MPAAPRLPVARQAGAAPGVSLRVLLAGEGSGEQDVEHAVRRGRQRSQVGPVHPTAHVQRDGLVLGGVHGPHAVQQLGGRRPDTVSGRRSGPLVASAPQLLRLGVQQADNLVDVVLQPLGVEREHGV